MQLVEAAAGRFNPHVHVEYEWNLRLEEIDESDDDLDDKVCVYPPSTLSHNSLYWSSTLLCYCNIISCMRGYFESIHSLVLVAGNGIFS